MITREVKMNGRQVKLWMVENGIDQKKMAKRIGVTAGALSLVARGLRGSKKMVEFLISEGCPAEYFKGNKVRIEE